MKNISPYLIPFFCILFLGCSPQYISPHFDAQSSANKAIAILPIEMELVGRLPEDWTQEDITKIEAAESKSFQISLYREIMGSTRRGRRPISVQIQNYRTTQQKLLDHEITIQESWKTPPEELAEILEVQAVVSGHIIKRRYMSDLASYGIELGAHIFNLITQSHVFPWIPFVSQSKNIQATYELISTEGFTLWSVSFEESANWTRPSNEIIDGISRRAARKFPYRTKY